VTATATGLRPLDVLFEVDGLPRVELPAELARLHGGGLGFQSPALYANFVATLDGVVAVPSLPQSNKLISAGSEADRFLLGLLRAFADAVVIGSGTLHGSPSGSWEPDSPDDVVADQLAQLRASLHLPAVPELAILTRSGAIDVDHPVLDRGALVLTTDAGATALENRVPPASRVVSLGDDVEPVRVVSLLRERGHDRILSEAGPTVFGAFLDAGLVDEVFLTLSPLLAGDEPGDGRLHLVEGASWVPGSGPSGRLLSVRRDGSHLFLRYALR
jgi:riboflavin biosynthesis pyrimidine reductase